MTKFSTICLSLSIATSLVLFGAMPAVASTPDGETPHEESICDDLHDATPGLYGLCVAYCEAQDCDFEDAVSGQCAAPNPKLLDIYERKRADEDPAMPCVLSEDENLCPCFGSEDLSALELVSCDEIDFGFALDTVLSDEPRGSGVMVEVVYDGTGRCMYRDGSDPTNPLLSDTATDPTQTAACQMMVDEYVDANAITCHYHD
jgi:hypothetical protein